MKRKDITIVAGMHGDEPIPVIALASMHIKHIVGNPEALSKNKRFLDSDLNGVFGDPITDKETERAAKLLSLIPDDKPVLDFHSTTSIQEPFVIIIDMKMLPLARKTGLSTIVYLKLNFKAGKTLIDHRDGVVVETGQKLDHNCHNTTLQVLDSIENEKEADNIFLFEVYDKITEPGEYNNFELYDDSFYPVFATKCSYDFIGLKAKREKIK